MVIAIYLRVSTNKQDTRSQELDLSAWAKAQEEQGHTVLWFREKATGTNYNRKTWEKLHKDIQGGKINKLVVWRLDRLGRLAGQTISLLDELETLKVGFFSLRDGFDPSTPAGRLTRNVLASVAQFETEVRRERQIAGIQAAKEAGKKIGGGKAGRIISVTEEKQEAIKQMIQDKKSVSETARVLEVTRQTVYRVLGLWTAPKREPETASIEQFPG